MPSDDHQDYSAREELKDLDHIRRKLMERPLPARRRMWGYLQEVIWEDEPPPQLPALKSASNE